MHCYKTVCRNGHQTVIVSSKRIKVAPECERCGRGTTISRIDENEVKRLKARSDVKFKLLGDYNGVEEI